MNKKIVFILVLLVSFFGLLQAQTDEELKAMKAEKESQLSTLEGQVAALKGEIAGINKQLVVLPRWETGSFGVLGLDFTGFNNWLAREQPSTVSSKIGAGLNAYANHFAEKSFWRNSANVNLAWIKFDDKDNADDISKYQQAADALNISSLYGWKISPKLAISSLGEYRTTVLSNYNNPGYLDIGAGMTWTPIQNLVVVAHPLNYNFVFSKGGFDYQSSLGAKIVADYNQKIGKASWRSNLSTFLSYKDLDALSNWTWVNGIGFNLWKGIGVGFELGLRKSKQEAVAKERASSPLQSYYVLGLSYALGNK